MLRVGSGPLILRVRSAQSDRAQTALSRSDHFGPRTAPAR
jgi:hypothetical protein